MPKSSVFVEKIGNVGQKWKIITLTQKLIETAGNGCNLTDDRYNTMTQ